MALFDMPQKSNAFEANCAIQAALQMQQSLGKLNEKRIEMEHGIWSKNNPGNPWKDTDKKG